MVGEGKVFWQVLLWPSGEAGWAEISHRTTSSRLGSLGCWLLELGAAGSIKLCACPMRAANLQSRVMVPPYLQCALPGPPPDNQYCGGKCEM